MSTLSRRGQWQLSVTSAWQLSKEVYVRMSSIVEAPQYSTMCSTAETLSQQHAKDEEQEKGFY